MDWEVGDICSFENSADLVFEVGEIVGKGPGWRDCALGREHGANRCCGSGLSSGSEYSLYFDTSCALAPSTGGRYIVYAGSECSVT